MKRLSGSQFSHYSILTISLDAQLHASDAATIHTIKLADAISRQAHKVTVVMGGTKNHTEIKSNLEIIYVKLPISSRLFVVKFCNLIIKNIKLYKQASKHVSHNTAIYERHNISSLVGISLSKRYGKKLFFEVNSLNVEQTLDEYGIKNKIIIKTIRGFMKWQLKKASGVFVQTEELGELINKYYGPVPTIVVPNGATLNTSTNKPHGRGKILNLIYVGAIDRYHMVDKILDAFSGINDRAELSIIGNGPDLQELKKKYVQKNIKFLGEIPHEQTANKLAAADIGIAQYNLDSNHFTKYGFYFCPLKIIEYAASALPSIYIGKPNSFINKFKSADACIIIESVDELKGLITYLDETPSKLKEISQNAYTLAKHLTWEETGRKTLEAMNV